jgi:hypothetical protein
VFNAGMKANLLVLAALAALLALPASAGARIIEVGGASATVNPSCPATPCEVVSRTTAFQQRVGATRDLYVAPRDGRIVGWTITLGKPKKVQTEFFQEILGGASRAGITVLKRGDRNYARVLARSPVQTLTPYFGRTVQFPLTTSLPVEKGNLVALTVPTWAPALALGLGQGNVWRASRGADACDDTQTQTAQTDINDLQQYKCKYRTARLAYSATLITTPKPPKDAN